MLTKPKKSLGQNFLIDKNILQKIINTVPINKDNEILEIGPGTGNLTSYIIKKNPKKIFVVEKDSNLSLLLYKKFKNKINIINDDILKISENLISKEKLIVFGNLPYNISTKILSKWIISINNNFWFSPALLGRGYSETQRQKFCALVHSSSVVFIPNSTDRLPLPC